MQEKYETMSRKVGILKGYIERNATIESKSASSPTS